MSDGADPRRWRDADGDASERARALVRAGGAPVAMSAAQRARGLAAVERIAAMPLRPWWLTPRALGWFGTALALGVAAALVVLAQRERPVHRPPAVVPAHHAGTYAPIALVRDAGGIVVAELPVVAPTPAPTPLPLSPPRARVVRAERTAQVAASVDAAVASDDLLTRENALIRRIRAAVQTEPQEALALVSVYDAEFPAGTNYELRAWLEVQALERLGRADEARERARDALRRSPGGMYTAQLNRVLERDAAHHDPSAGTNP